MKDAFHRRDEPADGPGLDEQLAAYHEALLAGEEAGAEDIDGDLARAQRCLKLFETVRRQEEPVVDPYWLTIFRLLEIEAEELGLESRE